PPARGPGLRRDADPARRGADGGRLTPPHRDFQSSGGLLRQGERDPVSRFRFIDAEKASYPVATLCRVLGASRAGYYAWRRRPRSARAVADAALTETIGAVHRGSRGTYGAPRVRAELAAEHGVRCSRRRVARLMRRAGLVGCHRRRAVRTTRRDA